jgi:subtilisin family serine protease
MKRISGQLDEKIYTILNIYREFKEGPMFNVRSFLIVSSFLFTQNIFSKEYIVRTSNNANFFSTNFKSEYFSVLGRKYSKVIVPNEKDSEFHTLMKHNFSGVEYEENIEYKIFEDSISDIQPSEPDFFKLWGLENNGKNEPITPSKMSPVEGVVGADINAKDAWAITKGDKNLVIAVIDTGIDYNHPDLKNNMWINSKELNGKKGVDDDGNGFVDDIYGYDVSNNDSDPMDDNKHGTHVAGVIGATHNGFGTVGVMANVSLMAVKFTDANGRGDLDRGLKGIDYAVRAGAKILSNSWGNKIYSKFLEDAIRDAGKKGVVFIAAAGNFGANNNDDNPIYPASYKLDNVISVGAFSAQDYPSAFSCFGPKSVHISAPGTNIFSTTPGNTYSVFSGTSQATPFVTGVVGLALSKNPNLTPLEIKNKIIETATPVKMLTGKNVANGRINAGKLLESL